MRIVLVCGDCPPGRCGVGDFTVRLASALRSVGIEAELLLEGSWGMVNSSRVKNDLINLKPDIVHIQYPTAGFGYRLVPQLLAMKQRCVITLHEASQAHILRKLSLYPFTVRPRQVIFTSEYERRFARKWAPWIARRSSVIPVGSNIDAVPNGVMRKSSEIAYFGLIAPRKGLEKVLKLATLIRSAGSAMKIRIIGTADQKHETYLQQLRIQSRELPIIWETGLDSGQVAKQLTSCAIAYLPFPDGASERRGSLKAMLSNGVVTVTTSGPHTPSELDGVVKFSRTPEDAYDAIRLLVENPVAQEKLRQSAIGYMRRFSWDRIADLHARLYESVTR